MEFTESRLPGVWFIDPKKIEDSRGFFAMTWLPSEFASRGLEANLAQCNLAFNYRRHTLRGLHFQTGEHGQVKLIRCTSGALFDVVVDLRPDSPTYRQWDSVYLTAGNHRMIYIPVGFAHGYLTLADGTEAYYHASKLWAPKFESGVRWNDPAFGIKWPAEPFSMSEKDANWPLLT